MCFPHEFQWVKRGTQWSYVREHIAPNLVGHIISAESPIGRLIQYTLKLDTLQTLIPLTNAFETMYKDKKCSKMYIGVLV